MKKQELQKLDELLEENRDVLIRLKTLGDEYYTQEKLLKSFKEMEKLKKTVDEMRECIIKQEKEIKKKMTIKELKEKIANLSDDTIVMVDYDYIGHCGYYEREEEYVVKTYTLENTDYPNEFHLRAYEEEN